MNTKYAVLPLLLGLAACASEEPEPRDAAPESVAPTGSPGATPGVVPMLDGPLQAGRHRFTMPMVCEEGDEIGCPRGTVPPSPIALEVTVPDGWQHWREYGLITPDEGDGATSGPDGSALVMGWTSFHVGLNSDPCLTHAENREFPGGHETPDVEVGPTVDDFVDAVRQVEAFDVSRPVDVRLGNHRGRYFELEGPDDLSRCELWRPWDPGFWVQGESNHWNVWVMDIDGVRVLIVTQHFPDTPAARVAELGGMVESIRFNPAAS